MADSLSALLAGLAEETSLWIDEQGRPFPEARWQPDRPMVVLPGSFNPVHAGHWGLAEAAAKMTGLPVAFELSLIHVDKPALSAGDVEQRLACFRGQAGVWLTRAPRFVQKAALFPGATFALGADTAQRVLSLAYYESEAALHDALRFIERQECRVLVAGRTDDAGRFLHLSDLPVPPEFRSLFVAVPADLFRLDVSSTMLRQQAEP
jgi:nicotinic acid mononucleotide adenylyltransferase